MKTLLVLACLLVPSLAMAQTVKNPTKLIFTPSPDHAQVTAYEFDIKGLTGVVVQTISFPKKAPDAITGEVTENLNVQPITFGSYTVVGRGVFGAFKSPDSLPSDTFERVPGAPGKPKTN